MLPAHVDLREHVLEPGMAALFIDIVHTSRDVEERDHLLHIGIDRERVRLARRLEYIVTGTRDPVVLKVAPRALDHVSMHGRGVAVTTENPCAAYAEQVAPL